MLSSIILKKTNPIDLSNFCKYITKNHFTFAACSCLNYIFLLILAEVIDNVRINQKKQQLEVFCKKKLFLEVSQNSQGNTCARVSILIKLQACEVSKNTFFKEHLWVTAPESSMEINSIEKPFTKKKILKIDFQNFRVSLRATKIIARTFLVSLHYETIVKYVFHELLWKKHFTVYPGLYEVQK